MLHLFQFKATNTNRLKGLLHFALDEEGLSSDAGNSELKLAVDDAIKKRKLARLTFERNLESAGLQLEYEYKAVSNILC